jgi:SagB-type dehydrogenase family enzyme
MSPKILWVLLPLLLYGVLLVLAWRGRAPSRLSVNMHGSLLLMVYLLCTAGLGIFWVANQQLPVFDWHYLFGYATLLLVGLHLFFNLPVLVRWLRRNAPAPPHQPMRAWTLAGWLAAPLALVAAFWLGAQFDGAPAPHAASADNPIQAVLRFHEYSSESRTSAFRRAPVPALDVQPPVFKSYPDAPHIPLARGAPSQDGRPLSAMLRGPGAARPLTLAALGQILFLSAGVTAHRGGLALRAAPSSGALFPAELYIAVRGVDGLPAGLYHYDPQYHRLDGLGSLPPSLAPLIGNAGALVVVAAIFDRTAWKYRNRAYRYVAADLGHLLENVRLAGHYTGLRVHLPVLFPESQLARAFNLDSRHEGVLALARLGGTADAGHAGDETPGGAVGGGTVGRTVAGAVAGQARDGAAGGADAARVGAVGRTVTGAGAVGVTEAVHAATSLEAGLADDASRMRPIEEAEGELVQLPRVGTGEAGADLYGTIARRRSQRRFAAEDVPLTDLAALLAEMSQEPLLSDAVRVDLVVNRVAGIKPGVYRYLPQRHALKRIRVGRFAEQAQSAALSQDVVGAAAVVLILSADRKAMFAKHGARGYRLAFLEAGMMGQRWLLGATARGLAACPVGAFYDDEAARLISVNPQQRWVLHFAALGKPAH